MATKGDQSTVTSEASLMRWRLYVGVVVLCVSFTCRLPADEKYSIARQATMIVVAQFHDAWSYPWFDGWHVRGILTVSRVVRGDARPTDNLSLRFVCSCCPMWPRPAVAT